MGYQSVGKSSLLEALANHQVSLPRGMNTVTRSPIKLELRDSEIFKCTIQVRQHLSCLLKLPGSMIRSPNIPCAGKKQRVHAVQ